MRFKRQDGTVAKYPKSVIPAKAGIQNINGINGFWIPAFAGMIENVISQQRQDGYYRYYGQLFSG